MATMKSQDYHKSIRKPIAPPTKVFKTKRDYSREQNYAEIDLYLTGLESEEGEVDAEETRQGR